MKKIEKIALACCVGIVTVASGVTAIEVTKLVEKGLEMEITVEEAQAVIDAARAAEQDIQAEEGE